MPRKKYTPEVIIRMLREAEVEVGQGLSVAAAYNLLAESRDCHVRQLVTSTYPSGWSGTLAASSSTSIVVNVPNSEAHLRCATQVALSDSGVGGIHEAPVTLYFPESHAPYTGEVEITSAAYTSGVGNVIDFDVSGDTAKIYFVLRDSGAGWSLVEDQAGTFAPGSYRFIDATPPAGTNKYRVTAGVEANGNSSDVETIVNS